MGRGEVYKKERVCYIDELFYQHVDYVKLF